MTQTTAPTLESEFQVVHAIPGRVRLRTTNSELTSALDKIAQQLRQQDGVCEVQTNPTTNSLVITFDESTLSLPQTLERLQIAGIAEISEKTQVLPELKLEPSLQEQSDLLAHLQKTFPETSVQVVKSLIPMVAGFVVTGALAIEGLVAIPVYVVAANVTREVIKQIESATQEADQVKPSGKTASELNGKSTTFVGDNQPETGHSEVAYKVVHEIPGRIRFRVPQLTTDPEYAQRLTVLTQTDANVTDVRVNTTAGSMAVSYDPGFISDTTMRSHLTNLIQSASRPDILIDLKAASNQEEPEQESNSLTGLALPALSATVALLGGPMGLPIPPLIIGGTIAVAALPVAQRAFESILIDKRLNIDCLDLMAVTITTLQGHFISPSLMILLVEIGEAIREQTAKSSKLQTLDLLDSLKQFVWVERNGQKQEISIHDVQRGDTVIVYPGDQIPVDGEIIRGKALIDEQKLTGESMPVMRKKGQTVYTSTLVREGQLYIRAEKVGAETRAGQIIKVMQDAPVHDTRIENYAAKVADQMVVPTI
ncbi:MAG: hypothetical protein LDL41_22345, partial [Coleofasciculus sp. S288]|nr:hypothetical protein [Coleofasciculus sp. S288]